MNDARAYIIFTGGGPILVVSTFESILNPEVTKRFKSKGIEKFIAYEVEKEAVRDIYGDRFEKVVAELEGEDITVLDFNGHYILSRFSVSKLGEPIKFEG